MFLNQDDNGCSGPLGPPFSLDRADAGEFTVHRSDLPEMVACDVQRACLTPFGLDRREWTASCRIALHRASAKIGPFERDYSDNHNEVPPGFSAACQSITISYRRSLGSSGPPLTPLVEGIVVAQYQDSLISADQRVLVQAGARGFTLPRITPAAGRARSVVLKAGRVVVSASGPAPGRGVGAQRACGTASRGDAAP
jgi:hypothetical protein